MTIRTIDFGFRPRPWQQSVAQRYRRHNVLVIHRRAGKSTLALATNIQAALENHRGDGRYMYLAPFRRQAKDVMWEKLKRWTLQLPRTEINEQELTVRLYNGSRIIVNGADNPDALRGPYLDGVTLDEVAWLKPRLWGEVIRPQLQDFKGWSLFIGTPAGVNLLSLRFQKALQNRSWLAMKLTVDDTQVIDPDELAEMKRDMTEAEIAQELYCDFTAAGPQQLIEQAAVLAAQSRIVEPFAFERAARVLGVDVAGDGEDRSVIVARQGLVAFKPKIYPTQDWEFLAAAVAQAAKNFRPHAIFVDASGGWGASLVGVLRSLGIPVHGVEFGGKPIDPKFANKRAEMWWALKEWLKSGGALPQGEEWIEDLCGVRHGRSLVNGRLVLESKEKMKARGLLSPDIGDALAVTFAFEVQPGTEHPGVVPKPEVFEPYARL